MKVKHLNFKITLEGSNIVNFDSKEQKFFWNRESKEGNKNSLTSVNDNNMYSKKSFFKNEQGKLDYKIKISSETLRKSIFNIDAIAINPSIIHNKTLFNSFVGSFVGLVRGYTFAEKFLTVNRKSALTICEATQINNAVSHMDFKSRSGEKKVKDDSENSDTSLYKKESVGDITYESRGFIDVQTLQFLSSDPIFDRYSFSSDDYEILKVFLNKTLPNFNNELGYYKLKTSCIDVSEYGIKLTNEQTVFLIKELLKRILSIKLLKATGYAKVDSLTIDLVYDAIDNSKNETIEIKSFKDIDSLDFEVEDFYILTDESEAKKQRIDIENSIKEMAKKATEEKKAAEEKKRDKKK